MPKTQNTSKWGSAKARERYADGGTANKPPKGNVKPLPIDDSQPKLNPWGYADKEDYRSFAKRYMDKIGGNE